MPLLLLFGRALFREGRLSGSGRSFTVCVICVVSTSFSFLYSLHQFEATRFFAQLGSFATLSCFKAIFH